MKDATEKLMGGTLLLAGGIQWFLGLLLAEAWYPGYSSRIDYVSDLGTGPTAVIYNLSVFILGACIVASMYFIHLDFKSNVFSAFFTLTGVGAMGVGVFPANIQPLHSLFTLVAILFGALTAIVSFKLLKSPLRFFSAVLGFMSLAADVIFIPYLGLPVGATDTYLGMAKGSMERWAIYPILAWLIGFGGHLVDRTPASSQAAQPVL
ncbi:MAG: DUF998 domain-containing protein [Candidatus Thorarchaeota archaeon]